MRILVTNDDGLHAPGLIALASAAAAAGHDVLAVAPEGDRSGSSSAVGNLGRSSAIRCRDMPLAGLESVQSVELDGPPALCVITSCLEAFGAPPELVLSGVNPGLNTGRLTLHSGTVGAVLTAANFGRSGVAVSIDGEEHSVKHWALAAELAVAAGEWVMARDGITTLNLSVPDRAPNEILAPCFAQLAPLGVTHAAVTERDAERLVIGFRSTDDELPEGSDSRLAAEGHVVITPLTGIRAAPLDEADHLLGSLGSLVVGSG